MLRGARRPRRAAIQLALCVVGAMNLSGCSILFHRAASTAASFPRGETPKSRIPEVPSDATVWVVVAGDTLRANFGGMETEAPDRYRARFAAWRGAGGQGLPELEESIALIPGPNYHGPLQMATTTARPGPPPGSFAGFGLGTVWIRTAAGHEAEARIETLSGIVLAGGDTLRADSLAATVTNLSPPSRAAVVLRYEKELPRRIPKVAELRGWKMLVAVDHIQSFAVEGSSADLRAAAVGAGIDAVLLYALAVAITLGFLALVL